MNVLEKEIKVLHINLFELILKLEKLWATRLGMGSICDHYYDIHKKKNLASQSKRVRIRYWSEGTKITMKKRIPAKDVKIAHEDEFEIENLSQVKGTFKKHWLLPSRQKWKTRLTYVYKDIRYDIDMYPWIPPLVEIEALSKKKILEWMKLVGLESHDTTTVGAIWLMKRYWKKPLKFEG